MPKKIDKATSDAIRAKIIAATTSPEGMRALSADLREPIYDGILSRDIASVLLTRDVITPGENPRYPKVKGVKAYAIAHGGQAVESPLEVEYITPDPWRVASFPTVDRSHVRNGNVGRVLDATEYAADEIAKKLNAAAISLVSASVPNANIINATGGTLTEAHLEQAIALIEDLGVETGSIVMRRKRFSDISNSETLGDIAKSELRKIGVFKNYGEAKVITNPSAVYTEVLVLPKQEVGKLTVFEDLVNEELELKTDFKYGWLSFMEVGMVVLRPDLIAKIVIGA